MIYENTQFLMNYMFNLFSFFFFLIFGTVGWRFIAPGIKKIKFLTRVFFILMIPFTFFWVFEKTLDLPRVNKQEYVVATITSDEIEVLKVDKRKGFRYKTYFDVGKKEIKIKGDYSHLKENQNSKFNISYLPHSELIMKIERIPNESE